MQRFFIGSLLLHAGLLLLFAVGLGNPFQQTIKDQQPLLIDFVQIGPKSAAPKLSTANQMETPKPAPVETPPQKQKEEAPENRDVKQEEKKPQVEEKKPVEAPAPEPKKEVAPIAKKTPEKKPEKKQEPKKQTPDKKKDIKPAAKTDEKETKPVKKPIKKSDKAQVNLKEKSPQKKSEDKTSKKASASDLNDLLKDMKESETDGDTGAPAETVGDVITATEIDAIRQKIRKCWIVPAGLKGMKDMVVDIAMQISKDGTVTKADVVDKARMASDPAYQTAAENARRAVLDPACNPLPLSPEKYDQWKDLELSFNPKDMF